MINNEIEFRNLSFAYSEKPVFENLNLKFKVGGKYGIIGKSGSGKTTLLIKNSFGTINFIQRRITF